MKYVECDYCGKHIHEGDKCYNDRYCPIYRSPECMLKDQFRISSKELDDSLVEDCGIEFKEE